jgi:tetratricopeptide (TPR) repeat protein
MSAVSFFEAELVLAALLGKPIHLFVLEGFTPGERLSNLLGLLSFALPQSQWLVRKSEIEILRGIRVILEGRKSGRIVSVRNKGMAGLLLAKAYQDRGIRDGRSTGRREILFMDGQYEARASRPDKELVEQLLCDERSSLHAESKLARLWIAIRELMACPPEADVAGDFVALWNESLRRWASNAAWYGLHGHIYVGQLAALYSAGRLRARLRPDEVAQSATLNHPGGLASALYSLSKLMPNWGLRREVLNDGFAQLNVAILERGRLDANLAQLRGSFHFRMRSLFRAVDDYEEALRLRELEHSSEGQIGESMSELGFAYLTTGRVIQGFDLLELGVELLEKEKIARPGFYIRGLKKLSIGYAARGRLIKARQTLELSRRVAAEFRMFDQL